MLRRLGLAITAGAALSGAAAPEGSAANYLISMNVYEAGRLTGTPSLTAREGQPASIAVGGRYRIRIVAQPDTEREGNVLLTSDITLSLADGDHSQSATVSLRPQQLTVFELAPPQARSGETLRVELSAASFEE